MHPDLEYLRTGSPPMQHQQQHQVQHDLTLDTHRTRLLERLLLSRQRHFGDREILLSGLSTAASSEQEACGGNSGSVSNMTYHPQEEADNFNTNIEVLLKAAGDQIVRSEASTNNLSATSMPHTGPQI